MLTKYLLAAGFVLIGLAATAYWSHDNVLAAPTAPPSAGVGVPLPLTTSTNTESKDGILNLKGAVLNSSGLVLSNGGKINFSGGGSINQAGAKTGIGTDGAFTLDVYNNSSVATDPAIVRINTPNTSLRWTGLRLDRNSVEKWFVGLNGSNDNLSFRNNSTTDVIVVTNTTGYVGIGAVPTTKLDINSTRIRLRTSGAPATSTTACNQGEISWGSSYIYVCVATNSWRRAALAAW